jgi:PAS domain S-box-containing protein
MNPPLKILLLEDCSDDVTLIEWQLKNAGLSFTLLVVINRHDFQSALTDYKPDVILSDHSLPNFNSIEAFEIFKAHRKEGGPLIPFILVTGNVSEEFAVQSIKAGIDDYILKDRLKRLPLAIKSALEKCKIENERLNYLEQVFAKEALMNEAEQLGHFGSWEVDLRTGKHRWSDATFFLYGLKPGEQEPNDETFFNSVHQDDLAFLKETVEDFLQRKDEAEYEFRILDRTGQVKYINCKVKVERDADAMPVRLVGFNLDISERKKAANALKESEQEFRSLLEQNPDTVFSLDVLGRFTRVNKGFIDMVGYNADELLGKDFRTILIKSELEKVYQHFLCALGRKPQRYETTFVNKAGKRFDLDVTLMAVVVDGRIIGTHCIAKDITEKRNFENLLDQAYRTARIGSWEFDLSTNKLYWAGITKELHEVSDDYEPTLESGVAFYKEGRSREMVSQAVQRCIDHDVSWDLELEIVTAKGNERWVRAIGQGAMENGKCVRLYGTFQDIHDRKIAEEASRKAFEEKVNVLESIGDAFFAVNERWMVTYWNKMAETILKMPRSMVLGKNIWEVYEDAVPLEFYKQYQKAMVERVPVHFEEYYPALHMWIEVNVYPSVDGLAVYFKDITKQKSQLRQIAHQHEQLTGLARVQSQDVRTQLMTLINLLNGRVESDPALSVFLAGIAKSAQDLDVLVRDIVSTSEKLHLSAKAVEI